MDSLWLSKWFCCFSSSWQPRHSVGTKTPSTAWRWIRWARSSCRAPQKRWRASRVTSSGSVHCTPCITLLYMLLVLLYVYSPHPSYPYGCSARSPVVVIRNVTFFFAVTPISFVCFDCSLTPPWWKRLLNKRLNVYVVVVCEGAKSLGPTYVC